MNRERARKSVNYEEEYAEKLKKEKRQNVESFFLVPPEYESKNIKSAKTMSDQEIDLIDRTNFKIGKNIRALVAMSNFRINDGRMNGYYSVLSEKTKVTTELFNDPESIALTTMLFELRTEDVAKHSKQNIYETLTHLNNSIQHWSSERLKYVIENEREVELGARLATLGLGVGYEKQQDGTWTCLIDDPSLAMKKASQRRQYVMRVMNRREKLDWVPVLDNKGKSSVLVIYNEQEKKFYLQIKHCAPKSSVDLYNTMRHFESHHPEVSMMEFISTYPFWYAHFRNTDVSCQAIAYEVCVRFGFKINCERDMLCYERIGEHQFERVLAKPVFLQRTNVVDIVPFMSASRSDIESKGLTEMPTYGSYLRTLWKHGAKKARAIKRHLKSKALVYYNNCTRNIFEDKRWKRDMVTMETKRNYGVSVDDTGLHRQTFVVSSYAIGSSVVLKLKEDSEYGLAAVESDYSGTEFGSNIATPTTQGQNGTMETTPNGAASYASVVANRKSITTEQDKLDGSYIGAKLNKVQSQKAKSPFGEIEDQLFVCSGVKAEQKLKQNLEQIKNTDWLELCMVNKTEFETENVSTLYGKVSIE